MSQLSTFPLLPVIFGPAILDELRPLGPDLRAGILTGGIPLNGTRPVGPDLRAGRPTGRVAFDIR